MKKYGGKPECIFQNLMKEILSVANVKKEIVIVERNIKEIQDISVINLVGVQGFLI